MQASDADRLVVHANWTVDDYDKLTRRVDYEYHNLIPHTEKLKQDIRDLPVPNLDALEEVEK